MRIIFSKLVVYSTTPFFCLHLQNWVDFALAFPRAQHIPSKPSSVLFHVFSHKPRPQITPNSSINLYCLIPHTHPHPGKKSIKETQQVTRAEGHKSRRTFLWGFAQIKHHSLFRGLFMSNMLWFNVVPPGRGYTLLNFVTVFE